MSNLPAEKRVWRTWGEVYNHYKAQGMDPIDRKPTLCYNGNTGEGVNLSRHCSLTSREHHERYTQIVAGTRGLRSVENRTRSPESHRGNLHGDHGGQVRNPLGTLVRADREAVQEYLPVCDSPRMGLVSASSRGNEHRAYSCRRDRLLEVTKMPGSARMIWL